MKKIFSLALIGLSITVSAQFITPRFGTTPNKDNTGRVLTYGYVAPSYAASYTITATKYETTVKMGTLTGALSFNADVTNSHVSDKLNLIFTADGTNRIVSLATGFSAQNDTVLASTTHFLTFVFDGVKWARLSGQDMTTGLAGNGSVGSPSIGFSSDTDNGFYRIGANNYGASIGGSKVVDFATTGISITGTIRATSYVAPVITRTATSYTASATVTASELAGGVLTVASGTVTLTLPTATQMGTQLGAGAGTTFDFVLLNAASGGTATVVVGTNIVASGFPSTNTLTLANSATIGVAVFRLTFISATAATLTRIN
ncbi:MAG: hypothetical protein V4538_16285 [Bacteroidota bacterium]